MSKKRLLSIYLNEFNYNYLIKGAKKFKCKHISKILKKKKYLTNTNDKVQNKNLDPWVQNVSINVGIESKYHKIYNLGEDIFLKQNQIWDILAKKNKKVLIWGPMNAKLRENKNLKIFFPDPWNSNQKTKPRRLGYLSLLPNYYARNYLKPSKFYLTKYSLLFFIGLFINGYALRLIKFLPFLIKGLYLKGFNNYILFLLLDLISIIGLKKETQKFIPDFSLIFLNSIAHFQHNHWNESKEQKNFFQFLDIIFFELISLENYYDAKLIFNGFSQKRVKDQYIIRPLSPQKFLKNIGLTFKKLNQNMTNGGLIFFNNKQEKNKNLSILNGIKLGKLYFFETHEIDDKTIFYRIQIISKAPIDYINSRNINKLLVYDKNQNKKQIGKFLLNLTVDDLINFKFIKSTGSHVSLGLLLYENININKKYIKKTKILNHNIFKIIRNYFDEK